VFSKYVFACKEIKGLLSEIKSAGRARWDDDASPSDTLEKPLGQVAAEGGDWAGKRKAACQDNDMVGGGGLIGSQCKSSVQG
jgi:hypothetical protein